MTYELDANHSMVVPQLHDGNLTGIQSEDGVVTLSLHTADKRPFRMVLKGATALRADDFRLGNIILDVRISTATDVAPERLANLYPGPHPKAELRFHDAYANALDGFLGDIREGRTILVEIDASYGCTLDALCSRVEVFAR